MTQLTNENIIFELILPRRPVSYNAKGKQGFKDWKAYVSQMAQAKWSDEALSSESFYFQILYICHENSVDIDNIIKPIQDSLVGIVIDDDELIRDISAHRRFSDDLTEFDKYPQLLQKEILNNDSATDIVYLCLCKQKGFGEFL